jgi:hypothetical protein
MITFSIGVFFWVSISYLFLKNRLQLKPLNDLWFLLVVVGLMSVINMSTMSECNTPETAVLYTVIPWMFIFLPMLIILSYFPSWKTPFSNTIGYFCIILNKENVNTLISLLKEEREDKMRILAYPWILMNQFTSDDFKNLEAKYGGAPVTQLVEPRVIDTEVKSDPESSFSSYLASFSSFSFSKPKNIYLDWLNLNDVENIQKFKKTLEVKELISTWVWYMLIAMITISTSYTLMMNASCIKTKIKTQTQTNAVNNTAQNAANTINP